MKRKCNMNDYICKICNQKIEANNHFFKNHKLTQSEYFEHHEPRLTKTGQKVIFKNIDTYFTTEFNDIKERNNWVKYNIEEAKIYFVQKLIDRKEKKKLTHTLSEIELKLLDLPKIAWFDKNFEIGYYKICKGLNYQNKYSAKYPKIDLTEHINIIIDSREQSPLKFPPHITTIIEKLNYGDMSLVMNQKVSVDRKTLSDMAGTMSAGFERFERELQRAKDEKGYLVLLVEESFNNFKAIPYLPHTKQIKASPEFLMKRMRMLYEEFDNFQICFTDGRTHAAKVVEFILKVGERIKKVDIQLLIDTKII